LAHLRRGLFGCPHRREANAAQWVDALPQAQAPHPLQLHGPLRPFMTTIHLSLISHTNVGKTTLTRTLLQREVGEVRDAPHVTEFSEGHTLITTAQGDQLQLWDTPGFGDSARLARRMRQSTQPLVWLFTQAWDRFTDRPFWGSQQALKHVREQTDLVLYLVNAGEAPQTQAHVASEMELLGWLGKPVLVLLNQMGQARSEAAEQADLQTWARHLQPWPQVKAVLPLDAFARCWVQEFSLWQAVQAALPAPQQAGMARLKQAWHLRRMAGFDAAMHALERALSAAANMSQPVLPGAGLGGKLHELARTLRLTQGDPAAVAAAQVALAQQLNEAVRQCTQTLVELHGLEGEAAAGLHLRLNEMTVLLAKVDEGKAALVGGIVTGALAGLKADIATGGLTLGGGALAGGVLGALGAAGVARGVNWVRDAAQAGSVRLNDAALREVRQALVLRYLAVAHFGRGQGAWVQGQAPAHWPPLVLAACAAGPDVRAAVWQALKQLYPEAMAALAAARPIDKLAA
jgi:GTP-binding protein EngB required for normal cell division